MTATNEPDGIFRRQFGIKSKSVDLEKRTVRVVASSADEDSYDEVVEQDWDLSRYNLNPVVLYNHNSSGLFGAAQDSLPIGFSTDFGMVGDQLEATLNFVDARANPMAELVLQQFAQGGMRAVSVGFRPGEVKRAKRAGRDVTVLTGNELFEISATPMGANPMAVARGISPNAGLIQKRLGAKATAADGREKNMEEIEKLQAEIATRTAELATVKQSASDATIEHGKRVATLEKSVTDLTTERDSFKARAEKAEKSEIEHEVMALVGKKIWPAEKADYIELRTANKALFERNVANRPDISSMTTTVTKDGNEPQENTVGQTGGASARLAAVAQKVG